MARTNVQVSSLIVATDIDTLPDTSFVEDHGDFIAVRSPSNPSHYWGNFLHFRRPPRPGARERWEAAFIDVFGAERASPHVALSWEGAEDSGLDAAAQFAAVGYDVSEGVGLIARPHELRLHARAARDVMVQRLDPDGDDASWDDVIQLQVDNREPGHAEAAWRAFAQQRMDDRRERFRRGEGAWLLARTADGTPAATCGIIVTGGRARYQAVDTGEPFRRRGMASRVVHDAGRIAIDECGATALVIVTEGHNPALGLYESLGFVARERTSDACWWPSAPHAARHPQFAAG
jgi:hypothetical protein